jgi:hypothetical protein
MTGRVSQQAQLVLVEKDADANVSQNAYLILWGIESSVQVSQAPVLVLTRPPVRRVIANTH